MRTRVLRRMLAAAAITAGVLTLVFATLIGPNLLPLHSRVEQTPVFLNKSFELMDQNGRRVTDQAFRGKPTAWFFGFTHCPDVCPTTLSDLATALDRLGPDADKLNVVFVTVDPERDTPEVLKEYLSSFDPRIVGLTGSREAIDGTTRTRFVHQAKVPGKNGDYMMEHTARVLLTAADGRFVGTIGHPESIDDQVEQLRTLIRAG